MFKIRIFRKRKKKRTSHHVTCYETPDESCVCVRMYRTFFVLSKSKSFTERMGINYLYAYAEKQRTSHHMWNVLFFFSRKPMNRYWILVFHSFFFSFYSFSCCIHVFLLRAFRDARDQKLLQKLHYAVKSVSVYA